MANYFDFLKNMTNPFEGVIDTITKPVDEGGINILGASAPKEFEAMKTAGLLTNEEYQDALNKADMRSKRNAIVQGLLGYGLQDFNKGYGSAFDPRYLKTGLASAIPAARKPFDELAPNVMNIEKLKTFKRDSDKDAKVREILAGGIYQDGKFNTSVIDDLIKAGDYKTADLISTIITKKQAAIKTLADTHERKEGKGGVIYYTPKGDSVYGVYMLDKSGNIVAAPEGYVAKPDIRPVGEGGLYDIDKKEQVVGGTPSLPKATKTIPKGQVVEVKKLIQGLYPEYAIDNIDNNTAVLIANRAEEIKSRKGNKGMGQEEAVKTAIEEINALHKEKRLFGDTFDFGKPDYEIRQPTPAEKILDLNQLPR